MNHKYEVILYWSKEGQAFIAQVPELAGCMSDGETQKEALEKFKSGLKPRQNWVGVFQNQKGG